MKKGTYGYISRMKLVSGLIAAAAFGMAAFVYFSGLHFFPAQRTMVAIVTTLICIPGAMALVRFIMFMRFKEGSREIHDLTEKTRGGVPAFYDSIITTSDKSYVVDVFVASENDLIGCTSYDKVDIPKLEKHLNDIFSLNKYQSLNIRVFSNADKYRERLVTMSERSGSDNGRALAVLHLVGRISL